MRGYTRETINVKDIQRSKENLKVSSFPTMPRLTMTGGKCWETYVRISHYSCSAAAQRRWPYSGIYPIFNVFNNMLPSFCFAILRFLRTYEKLITYTFR